MMRNYTKADKRLGSFVLMAKQYMRMVLLATITLCCHSAKAQRLTVDEMIRLTSCSDYECFNNVVSGKGFSFESTDERNGQKDYMFLSDKKLPTDDDRVTIRNSTVISFAAQRVIVGFRTCEKWYYQQLLSNFKNKGFKVTSTEEGAESITTVYRSSQYSRYSLMVRIDKMSKQGVTWNGYDFELLRNL